MSHRQPPAPSWAVDALFELSDPLPGCYHSLLPRDPIEGVAYVGPDEVTAKRPSRGRHGKHNQPTRPVR
jgi:hypothetical protein